MSEATQKKKVTPAKFVQQVKQETAKVTWPSKKETMASTGMVLVMVSIASLFFFVVDWAISLAVQLILGI